MSSLLREQLSPGMGSDVLALLRQLSPLPDRGIVAGQSVTSALLHLYGNGDRRGPFNDIDVFVSNGEMKRSLRMHFKTRQVAATGETSRIVYAGEEDTYPNVQYIDLPMTTSRPTIDITKVARDGILNFIHLNPARVGSNIKQRISVSAAEVVASFDLNAVEVAVNLETGQMSWTKDFAWFMKTSQLQVTNVHGETHSMTRILKKLEEMPWINCDLDATTRALGFTLGLKYALEDQMEVGPWRDRMKSFKEGDKKMPLVIAPLTGPAYMERYQRHKSKLDTWFQVEEASIQVRGTRLNVVRPRLDPESEAYAPLGKVYDLAKHFITAERDVVSQKQRYGGLSALLPVALTTAPSTSYRIGLVNSGAVERRAASLRKASEHFVAMQKVLETERLDRARARADQAGRPFDPARYRGRAVPKVEKTFGQSSYAIQGSRYLAGQVDERLAVSLENFIHAHSGLKSMLAPLSFVDQVAAMKNLKALDAKNDGIVIGVIEASSTHAILPQVLLDPVALSAKVGVLLEELNKPIEVLPTKFDPSYEVDGLSVRVTELLSPVALLAEGQRMNHCVGGYANEVREGTCRIFQFRSGKSVHDSSTLELRVMEGAGVLIPRVQQHRGFSNLDISPEHKTAEERFLLSISKFLNDPEQKGLSAPTIDRSLVMRRATIAGEDVVVSIEPSADKPIAQYALDMALAHGPYDLNQANFNDAIERNGTSDVIRSPFQAQMRVTSTDGGLEPLNAVFPVTVGRQGGIKLPVELAGSSMASFLATRHLGSEQVPYWGAAVDRASKVMKVVTAEVEYMKLEDYERKPINAIAPDAAVEPTQRTLASRLKSFLRRP